MNFTDGRVYDMNWKTTEDGAIFTTGNWFNTAMVIENENTLNIGDGWMILYREGTQDSGDEMPVAQPIGAEGEAYFGTWTMDLGGMAMNLTLNQDGTCAMEMMGESEPGVWTMENGKAYVMGDECQIDGDGNLVVESAGMVFVKMEDASSGNEEMSEEEALLAFLAMLGQMEGGEEGSLAPEAPVDYIPATMDDYIGGWICADDDSVQMLLLEGEATLIEDGVGYPAAWSVEDGIAIIDGMKLYTQEDWSGIMDMDGELIKFERGYVEKPKASAAPADTGDDEMTDEELLAFLALLGQMSGMEDTELPEHLKPYVGTWHMVYLATGGFEGDMRAMGVTGKLELNADGTGKLSGAADDSGKWYDDEGTVRFGKADTPLVLMDGGFLRYGSQLAGFMVFSQDPNAVWSPAPAATEVPAPTAAPVVSQGEKKGFSSLEERLDKKFICTSYVATYGGRQDASTLGAEYSLTFYSDGKLEFVMQGVPVTNLSWALKDIPRGLGTVQAFSFNYAMTDFNAVITDTGFEMDFYGSMLMTFELAE